MFNDIVNSIKATLYDRTSSPLFGSVVVSWAAWNYRLLIVLVSDGNYPDKLAFIDERLYPGWLYVLGVGVAGPLATALTFIYLYPWPARKVYEHAVTQQKKLRDLRKQIEGDELITEQEARKLRQDHVTMQIQFDTQFKALKSDRDALSEAAANLQGLNANMTEQVATIPGLLKQRDDLASEVERFRSIERGMKEIQSVAAANVGEAERRAYDLREADKLTEEEVANTLWRLTFNPDMRTAFPGKLEGTKRIHLFPEGRIGEGQNANESSWRLNGKGQLEFVQANGEIHSRFDFQRASGHWAAVADPGLLMKHPGQLLEPDESR